MSNFPSKKEINNALRVVQLKLKLGMIGNKTNKFDMGAAFNENCFVGEGDIHYCNSVGCIGGYVEKELVLSNMSLLESSKGAMNKLFYPDGYGKGEDDEWDTLSSKKAVIAIENYLKGHSDPWKGVAKRNTNKEYLRGMGEL